MSVHDVTKPQVGAEATPLARRGVFLLSQLGFHVATRCGEKLAPLGLETRHYGVLMHLTTHEGLSQQRLADTMGVHRNVMVGLIDDLEARDLVRRDRHPTDRRAHRLRLTSDGNAVLAAANAAVDDLEEEIFSGLSPVQRDRFFALLQHATNAAELPEGIHPGLRRRRSSE